MTAVEYAVEKLEKFIPSGNQLAIEAILEQAKEIEKEQIMSAFEAAEKDCGKDFLHGDLYYNEIFKSE